jgi:hypothetical protein
LNPDSFVELSLHDRAISLEETVTAERSLGSAGRLATVGVTVGVLVGVRVCVGVGVGLWSGV